MLKKFLFILFALLGITLAINALTYLNFDSGYKFLRLKQEAIKTGWYLPGYYSHVLISGIILVIGFIQNINSVRIRFSRAHRYLGSIYVFGILFFAAPGAIVMSFFIGRGMLVFTSFIVQCSLWLWFTTIAYQKAKAKDFIGHEKWMLRSFSLTIAAITLRIYIFIFAFNTDLSQANNYALLAWLSWVPNILLVEGWFYMRRKISTVTLERRK
jgi:hypothetical protein